MEARLSTEVTYSGVQGRLQVFPGGSVRFTSDKTIRSGCCGGEKPTYFEGADIIGASVTSHGQSSSSVYVLYCPAKVTKGKTERQLKKGGPFTVPPEQADELAKEIRNANNCHGDLQIGGRTVLGVVNPKAGKGKAADTWKHTIELLEAAGIQSDTVITTHPGHATEAVASSDLNRYACLIAVGGDGCLHEIIQGLRRHLQVPKSFATPLCHIPAGSGNGVAATCGLWTPATAAHALVKGCVWAMDAASVILDSENVPRLSILGVQYGLLTDLDLGTEHLRKVLGGERFTYGAVREILKWRKHSAHIAFCTEPAEDVDASAGQQGTLECPRLAGVQMGKADFASTSSWPAGWQVQTRDNIRYLNVAGPDWAALDARINPWGEVSDGLWEFAWDKCASRSQALKMILETQAGTHDQSPLFEMERVSAFIIEPVGSTTYLTVDGEKVALERLSVEVHRKLLTFVVAPNAEDAVNPNFNE